MGKQACSKKTIICPDLKEWKVKLEKVKEKFNTTILLGIKVAQSKQDRKISIKEKLDKHVATMYEHTDQSKTFCAPGTRGEIQKEIEGWLSPHTSSSEHIFWITGIAGSGKSTLSATVVDNLRKKHTPVAAQFFISRNIPETIDPTKIIPTIAQQLSAFSPAAAHIIQEALKDGFISPQNEQVEKLLLAPIRAICKFHDRVIILIDALDELQDAAKSVRKILPLLAASDLPDNVRFIITSRPDYWADKSRPNLNHAAFKRRALETDKKEVHDFIFARFSEIKEEQDKKGLEWDNWPNDKQVSMLSEKADGLFLYAETALQWIEKQIDDNGTKAQKRVFEEFSKEGIEKVENLYELILTSLVGGDGQTQDQLRGFQYITGTILVLHKPLTIHQIIALLDDIDFDVNNFLRRFRSVLIPGTTELFEEATPQIHKSFRDYIMGESAPPGVRIITGQAHLLTAKSCLKVIVKAGSRSDDVVEYSIAYWYQHLRRAVEGKADFGDEGGYGTCLKG
ncbi:hypothetical protein B0H13DRAFT_826831 [Mycena leptocephala]|nr:hypothetical protein B0H13DRAFT_826831 [Mycena leptocephala]